MIICDAMAFKFVMLFKNLIDMILTTLLCTVKYNKIKLTIKCFNVSFSLKNGENYIPSNTV
jgi:hypothetical protein